MARMFEVVLLAFSSAKNGFDAVSQLVQFLVEWSLQLLEAVLRHLKCPKLDWSSCLCHVRSDVPLSEALTEFNTQRRLGKVLDRA